MVNIKVSLRLRFTWLSRPFLLFEGIANIASPPGWVTSLPQVTTPCPHVGSSGYPHHHVGSTGYPPPQRGLHRLRPSPTRASRVNPLSQVSSTGYLPPQRGPHKLLLSPKWAPQIFHPPPPSRGHFVIFILSCVFLQFQYLSSCCSNLYCQRGVYYCIFIAGTAQSNCSR